MENSSLVLVARSLSMSTVIEFQTCFSTSRIMSSDWPSLAFLTCVTALVRTRLTESLALLLNCLASLDKFSLCSRVTLLRLLPVCPWETNAEWAEGPLTSGKLLRVKSFLRASSTAFMSIFTSSRLMMSSTRAELIFTLTAWPFTLARHEKTPI
uniref:Uncharacterized protein n=1 Tax=Periophthalmus magnuspinnatus TaxID=409849 RepID=A0A3B4BMQ7_9GOBI